MCSSFSFGMLKPDCLLRKLEEEAFRRIASFGLMVILQKRLRLGQIDIDFLYPQLTRKPFYSDMGYFLTSSDVLVFVGIGKDDDAVNILNRVVGFTDPKYAKTGTLRELGHDVRRNIAHSASDIETAARSIKYFFTQQEITESGLGCLLLS